MDVALCFLLVGSDHLPRVKGCTCQTVLRKLQEMYRDSAIAGQSDRYLASLSQCGRMVVFKRDSMARLLDLIAQEMEKSEPRPSNLPASYPDEICVDYFYGLVVSLNSAIQSTCVDPSYLNLNPFREFHPARLSNWLRAHPLDQVFDRLGHAVNQHPFSKVLAFDWLTVMLVPPVDVNVIRVLPDRLQSSFLLWTAELYNPARSEDVVWRSIREHSSERRYPAECFAREGVSAVSFERLMANVSNFLDPRAFGMNILAENGKLLRCDIPLPSEDVEHFNDSIRAQMLVKSQQQRIEQAFEQWKNNEAKLQEVIADAERELSRLGQLMTNLDWIGCATLLPCDAELDGDYRLVSDDGLSYIEMVGMSGAAEWEVWMSSSHPVVLISIQYWAMAVSPVYVYVNGTLHGVKEVGPAERVASLCYFGKYATGTLAGQGLRPDEANLVTLRARGIRLYSMMLQYDTNDQTFVSLLRCQAA